MHIIAIHWLPVPRFQFLVQRFGRKTIKILADKYFLFVLIRIFLTGL